MMGMIKASDLQRHMTACREQHHSPRAAKLPLLVHQLLWLSLQLLLQMLVMLLQQSILDHHTRGCFPLPA